MVERMVQLQLPDNINQAMRLSEIVCTDNFIIICSFGNRCFLSEEYSLFEYSFAKKEWNILLYNGLPHDFLDLKIIIWKKQYLVVHGMLYNEVNDSIIWRTYQGDITERPIRFQFISNLETMELNGRHKIVTDGDYLYDSITYEMNGSLQLTTFRLDSTNNWTEVSRLAQDIYPEMQTMVVVYEGILYIFPKDQNSIDFTKMIAVDLETGHRNMVDLLRADGPLPGFPFRSEPTRNSSLAQCPLEPRNVYLTLANDLSNTTWEVWRLDLDAMQWHRRPRYQVGQEAEYFYGLSSRITPAGRLFVLSSAYQVFRHADIIVISQGPRPRGNVLYSTLIRVPRLDDQSLDATMEYFRIVDPDWPRDRSIQNAIQWSKRSNEDSSSSSAS